MNHTTPRNWEEAFDQLADEAAELRDALDNIVSLWDLEAGMDELENSIARARILLEDTTPKEK
jgi:hypothetical protein